MDDVKKETGTLELFIALCYSDQCFVLESYVLLRDVHGKEELVDSLEDLIRNVVVVHHLGFEEDVIKQLSN